MSEEAGTATEDNEALAEHAAHAHLDARHPAIAAAYATDVPRHVILLDLREAGLCTCLLENDQHGRAQRSHGEPGAGPDAAAAPSSRAASIQSVTPTGGHGAGASSLPCIPRGETSGGRGP